MVSTRDIPMSASYENVGVRNVRDSHRLLSLARISFRKDSILGPGKIQDAFGNSYLNTKLSTNRTAEFIRQYEDWTTLMMNRVDKERNNLSFDDSSSIEILLHGHCQVISSDPPPPFLTRHCR